MNKLAKTIRNFVYEHVYSDRTVLDFSSAVFSFTFDDAPISSLTTGAAILERNEARGTFYVAMGLSDDELSQKSDDEREFLNGSDISSLHANGHDIQCHTYSHYSTQAHPYEKVLEDSEQNHHRIREFIEDKSVDHFAFPFGEVSLAAKRELGAKFKTLRTVEQGINSGSCDLNYLRGFSLCQVDFNHSAVLKVIRQAVEKKAWVIFFTHEVCDEPGDWGTKTDDFDWVVQQCIQVGGQIQTVEEVISRIHV